MVGSTRRRPHYDVTNMYMDHQRQSQRGLHKTYHYVDTLNVMVGSTRWRPHYDITNMYMDHQGQSQRTRPLASIQAMPGSVPMTIQEMERYGEPRQRTHWLLIATWPSRCSTHPTARIIVLGWHATSRWTPRQIHATRWICQCTWSALRTQTVHRFRYPSCISIISLITHAGGRWHHQHVDIGWADINRWCRG